VRWLIGKDRGYRQFDIAGAIFCAAISLGAYFVVLRPLMQQRTAIAVQQEELTIRQKKASQLAATTVSLDVQLQSVQQELAESSITLQPPDRINRQIAKLTKLIHECELKADDIQVGKVFKGSKYDIIPIVLAGRGEQDKCAAFLHKLSETFGDTGVGCFKITGNPEDPAQVGEFRFGLLWYASSAGNSSQE
jgi:Tfp pilus assembly protein PilO